VPIFCVQLQRASHAPSRHYLFSEVLASLEIPMRWLCLLNDGFIVSLIPILRASQQETADSYTFSHSIPIYLHRESTASTTTPYSQAKTSRRHSTHCSKHETLILSSLPLHLLLPSLDHFRARSASTQCRPPSPRPPRRRHLNNRSSRLDLDHHRPQLLH